MDFNEANAHFPRLPDGSEDLQRKAQGDNAMALIKQGLEELARLGMMFEIVEARPQPAMEFPKWVYHVREEPRLIENSEDLDKAKADGFTEEMPHVPTATEPTV